MERILRIKEIFPKIQSFRLRQIEESLFKVNFNSWDDVSNLPKDLRDEIKKVLPWNTLTLIKIFESKNKDTYKAILETMDKKQIESVLMKNKRGFFTLCISSQIGCAMNCSFCATGKMGIIRNLSSDEIIDQYRFWQNQEFVRNSRISNIVFMGMGEPLNNYDNVKETLNTILKYTDIGETKITVSTVGVLPRLEMILKDPDWPHVRIAISLHSADRETRQQIVPTSFDTFLDKMKLWGRAYLKELGNRKHHLTFEYVMLSGINDDLKHAEKLVSLVRAIGQVKVNLIPFNFVSDAGFKQSTKDQISHFLHHLEQNGVDAMVRKNMGTDIDAACGQLIRKMATNSLNSEL